MFIIMVDSSSLTTPPTRPSDAHSDMEVVPNSSGEGSTCDEEMSQEFPPLTGIWYLLLVSEIKINDIV